MISIVIAAFLASVISLFTLLGQLQVIRRINQISDISMGTQQQQPLLHLSSSQILPENCDKKIKPTYRINLSKFNIFGYLSEISLILKKLEWLEGKVKIVCAFIPVIAKVVSRQDISDSVVLESKLSRRMGCYLFVDIEGKYYLFII